MRWRDDREAMKAAGYCVTTTPRGDWLVSFKPAKNDDRLPSNVVPRHRRGVIACRGAGHAMVVQFQRWP